MFRDRLTGDVGTGRQLCNRLRASGAKPAYERESGLVPEEVYEKYPGGPKNSMYYKAEHPRHKVRITRPFYMGVHEVTVGDFKLRPFQA